MASRYVDEFPNLPEISDVVTSWSTNLVDDHYELSDTELCVNISGRFYHFIGNVNISKALFVNEVIKLNLPCICLS